MKTSKAKKSKKDSISLTSLFKVEELFIRATFIRVCKQRSGLSEINAEAFLRSAIAKGAVVQEGITRSEPKMPIYKVVKNIKFN